MAPHEIRLMSEDAKRAALGHTERLAVTQFRVHPPSRGECTMSDTTNAGNWTPAFKCDLTAGPQAFTHAVEKFREWAPQQKRLEIQLETGWHCITPEIAEQLLIRNRRNRKLRYPDVLRYATQMANGRWKKTGEPVIVNMAGDVEDAGHRLFACYFSGCSFETFVVSDVPNDDELFAFIDNGVSRTGEDTLHSAGLNGMSKDLQSVIKKFAIRYDEGSLYFSGRSPISPISNSDILDYAKAHPTLSDAVHLTLDVYPAAVARLGDRAAAIFLAWKIREAYGSGVLEDFMGLLTQPDLPNGHPVAALQQRIARHEAAKIANPKTPEARRKTTQDKLSDVKLLVVSMIAFNLWRAGQLNVRRLDPRMDDPFPRIDKPEDSDLAHAA